MYIVKDKIRQAFQRTKIIENPIYLLLENGNFPWDWNSQNSRRTGNSQSSGNPRISVIPQDFPYEQFPGGKSLKPYGREGMGISH